MMKSAKMEGSRVALKKITRFIRFNKYRKDLKMVSVYLLVLLKLKLIILKIKKN